MEQEKYETENGRRVSQVQPKVEKGKTAVRKNATQNQFDHVSQDSSAKEFNQRKIRAETK